MSDEYIPPLYEQNRAVTAFRASPRFGHVNDISYLFSSDHAEYTWGTIFISAFVLTLFVAWVLVLLIFTFLGRERVGFLSGYAMVTTIEANSIPRKQCCTTVTNVRSSFVFSCMVVIAVAIASTIEFGFHDLEIAIDGLANSALDLRNVAHEAQTGSMLMQTYGEYSQTLREIILPDVEYPNFCVNTSLDSNTGLSFNETRQQAVDDLEALGNFNVDVYTSVSNDLLEEVKLRSENTYNFFSMFGIHEWQTYTYMITYAAIAFTMMLATILSWSGKPSKFFMCTSTWLLLPTFIVVVFITWLILATYGIVAVMNADYCTGGPLLEGPDLSTVYILERSKIRDQSQLLYDASIYWFNGCQTESPFSYIEEYQDKLNSSISSMQALRGMMDNVTIPELERICGIIGDFDSIGLYFDQLEENFVKMLSSASNVADLLSCETINSIYIDAVHNNACHDVPISLLWTFISLLIVGTFGMIMITLRSAWLVVRERRQKVMNQMPIITVEKIEDLNDESFSDSPSPNHHKRFNYDDRGEILAETDESGNVLTNDEEIYDPVVMYQNLSVADESLADFPMSPKDPPGYKVY